MYKEDDMLMLSGIQHFRFCSRQWALIHLEQQWEDNRLTVEGQLLHKHVDDPFYRGKPKTNGVDEVQLAAQAMCLEEMYSIRISYGAFFYGEIRHRVGVEITPRLRDIVKECATEMHRIYESRQIPMASGGKHCGRCSLKDICVPRVKSCGNVESYLKHNLL